MSKIEMINYRLGKNIKGTILYTISDKGLLLKNIQKPSKINDEKVTQLLKWEKRS